MTPAALFPLASGTGRTAGRVGGDSNVASLLQRGGAEADDETTSRRDVGYEDVEMHLLWAFGIRPPRRPTVRPAVTVEGQLERAVGRGGDLEPVLANDLYAQQFAIEAGQPATSLLVVKSTGRPDGDRHL
jgi:hypothetical protein